MTQQQLQRKNSDSEAISKKPTIQQATYSHSKKASNNTSQIIELLTQEQEGETPIQQILNLLQEISEQQKTLLKSAEQQGKIMLKLLQKLE